MFDLLLVVPDFKSEFGLNLMGEKPRQKHSLWGKHFRRATKKTPENAYCYVKKGRKKSPKNFFRYENTVFRQKKVKKIV